MIALVNTSVSMTKQQIRTSVAGYADAPSPEAFERMFERDKDSLRDLGIPIVTVDAGGHSDEVGYRIDQDAYALPAVDLTPAEFGVLSLAAQFWQDKTLRTDISRALTKLRAAGAGEIANDAVAGLAPRVRAVGDAYGPLLDAIEALPRGVVHVPGGVHRRGTHAHGRAVAHRGTRGGWYLLGFDRERHAPRAFRLSRIEGRVRLLGRGGAYDDPRGGGRRRTAGCAGWARARGAPGDRSGAGRGVACAGGAATGTARVRARGLGRTGATSSACRTRTRTLADEIAGYGDAVVVLEPARAARRRRAPVARRHAPGSRGDGTAPFPDRPVRRPGRDEHDDDRGAAWLSVRTTGCCACWASSAYLDGAGGVPSRSSPSRFGVTTRQIVEDVDALWVSGTPGYWPDDLIDFDADSLERGVVRLTEARGMTRPLRLGTREAVALIAALRAMGETGAVRLDRARSDVVASAWTSSPARRARPPQPWTCACPPTGTPRSWRPCPRRWRTGTGCGSGT